MDTVRGKRAKSNLVNRKFKLAKACEYQVEALISEINQIHGINTIKLDPIRNSIELTYDGVIINIDTVLGELKQHGVEPKQGWWNQFKLDWYRQIDQNVSDNAKHVPHCCSKPPQGH